MGISVLPGYIANGYTFDVFTTQDPESAVDRERSVLEGIFDTHALGKSSLLNHIAKS